MATALGYKRYWLTFRSSLNRQLVDQVLFRARTLLDAEERAKSLLWTRRLTHYYGERWDGWSVATADGPTRLPKVVAYGDANGVIYTMRDHGWKD